MALAASEAEREQVSGSTQGDLVMTRSKLCLPTTIVLAFAATAVPAAQAQKIQVGIGHQSMCTDTYTAGIVIKELRLLEKHLPQDGKYKDATVRDHAGATTRRADRSRTRCWPTSSASA